MNTYQIVFVVTCFLLAQLVFVWVRYQENMLVDGLVVVVCMTNIVVAIITLALAATWAYEYLGTLS